MGIAEASQTRFAHVAEATIGVTPATPSFKTDRFTSEGLKPTKQTVISDEIRADGNVSGIIDVGRGVEGPLAFELSYGTFDDFLESLFRSAWATNVLKNGITHKSFTLEKTFEQGATDAFIRFTGVEVTSMDLTLESRQIVKGSFGLMGLDAPTPATAIISGATYAAPSTEPVLNAATNIGTLTVGGITAPPKIKSLSLSVKSNLYQNDVVASYAIDSLGLGRFEVSGSMSVYFADLDSYNAILGHTDVALTITIGAATTKKYTISIPKIKLMDGAPTVGGNGQAVMMDIPYQAYYDSGIGATMSITRAVA